MPASAALRCRGRCRLAGATLRQPSAAASRWWRPRSRARRAAAPPRPASGSRRHRRTTPCGRIFLVLDHGGVIECAQEIAARLKLAQETLVVDIETERLGGGVEIGAVNEQGHFFRFGFHDCSRIETSIPRPSRMAEICLDRQSEGFHSPESAQHPAFYRYRESYPRRN